MRCFLFFIAIFCSACSTAQTVPHKKVAVKTNTPCKESTEAEFKGGPNAWIRFLNKTLTVDSAAIVDLEFQSSYRANFIVTKEGLLKDIVVTPAEGAANDIIKVIKLSEGEWKPATCNKKPIKSRKNIQLTIHLETNSD